MMAFFWGGIYSINVPEGFSSRCCNPFVCCYVMPSGSVHGRRAEEGENTQREMMARK